CWREPEKVSVPDTFSESPIIGPPGHDLVQNWIDKRPVRIRTAASAKIDAASLRIEGRIKVSGTDGTFSESPLKNISSHQCRWLPQRQSEQSGAATAAFNTRLPPPHGRKSTALSDSTPRRPHGTGGRPC